MKAKLLAAAMGLGLGLVSASANAFFLYNNPGDITILEDDNLEQKIGRAHV